MAHCAHTIVVWSKSASAMSPARPTMPRTASTLLVAMSVAMALAGAAIAQTAPPPGSPLPGSTSPNATAVAPPPSPADLCVICEEPAALYRCRAAGADPAAAPVSGMQIKCVTEIAQRQYHGRCRIDRTRAAGVPCDGQFVAVTPPPPPLPSGNEPPKAATAPDQLPPPATAPPAEANAKKPPETMEALAKEAVKQSADQVKETSGAAGRQIEKAGSAVGRALKNSWECVSSLFSRC